MLARILLPLAIVLALAGTASAEKAKIAVLGLEVAGSIDTDSTSHGRLLTERFRAKTGISPRFMLAPNSMKDLLDEKVAIGCDNEAPDCMSKIGVKLKAQFLMYGKIEKRPKDGKEGYQLSMKSLDIDRKVVKEWGDWLPLADFVEPGALDARVATAFDTLTKEATVTATDPGAGTVITGPTGPTGPGPTGPTPKPKDGGFPWKTTAYVSTAVALAAFGGFVFTGPLGASKLDEQCTPGVVDGKTLDLGDADSYRPENGNGSSGKESPDRCAKGPLFSKLSYATGITAGVFGGIALVAYYKAFISKKESATQTSGRTRKKKQFAVTPILAPDGAGATFRLDW